MSNKKHYSETDRRRFLLGSAALLSIGACERKPGVDLGALSQARKLIAARPSLDLHAHPGKTFVRGAKNLSPALTAFTLSGANEKKTIRDMAAGGMKTAVFCAVSDLQVLDFSDSGLVAHRDFNEGEALASYRTQIEFLNKIFDDGLATKILSVTDIKPASQSPGVNAILGVEGGDFLEGSAERVAEAYADGVRCINPVHYRTNEIGDSMTANPIHEGLTRPGVEVIRAMNASGIVIDVAHASERTAFGMLETSEQPIICSHTHIRTESFDFPRFISLDLAKQISAAGGVIGAWPAGIGINNLDGFVDRIFELVDAVGVEHVGLSTDMDANYKPVWDNYRQFPEVVAKMLERGLGDNETAKIIGGNGLRVFSHVTGN